MLRQQRRSRSCARPTPQKNELSSCLLNSCFSSQNHTQILPAPLSVPLSPLRLYQQHNELFERTGAGATQSKTPKRGSSVPFGLVPKKQKKQKHRTRHHLQHKRRNFLKTNHKQFTIHESIHTHRTRTRRTPPTEAAQNRQQQTHQYDQRTKHTENYHMKD